MEMIDRYVFAVTKRLPHKQRNDIAEELRVLIEDMVEERQDGRKKETLVEEVLMELGNPKELAQKYRGEKTYIIGPDFYDSYLMVLKIVMVALSIGLGVVFAIETIFNPLAILDHFIDLIVSIVTVVPMAFGWVTFSFVLAERFGVEAKDMYVENEWKPTELPPIPNERKRISRSEAVFAIVFAIFGLVLFTFFSERFGVYINNDEGVYTIPFLNTEIVSDLLPFIYIVIGLSIIKEVFKLIIGKWSTKLATLNLFVNGVTFAVILWIIFQLDFWNPHFMEQLSQAGIVASDSEGYDVVNIIWERVTLWSLIIFAISMIWDMISGYVKAWKK